MTTIRTGEPRSVPPLPPEPALSAAVGTRARSRRWAVTAGLLLLAGLPALAGLVDLWLDRDGPYLPIGDHAILAMAVDAVGEHETLLGAYSRFGWFHPGPMGTYLFAGFSFLLGGALQALSAGMLVINGASAMTAVWLVRRRAGVAAALGAVVVLTLSVRTLGDDFIRDSWNPHLPVLPLLAGVLLCWTVVRGDAWALPLAVVPLTLAVQSHVGALPAVGAVTVVLVAGLLVRAGGHLRARAATGGPGRRPVLPLRWPVATVGALALTALLWLPAVIEQMTRTPGNASALYDHLLGGSPEEPTGIASGLRAVADEFGRLPASLVGAERPEVAFLPAFRPPVAIAVGLVAFAVTMAFAVRRRRADVLWLGTLTLAVAAAGVAAVARIDGPPYPYLVQWTVVIGILAWTTVGAGLLPAVGAALRAPTPGRRLRAPLEVPLAVLATAAVVVAAIGTGRADTPSTDVTGDIVRLEEAVVADLDRLGFRTGADQPVVRVDFSETSRPNALVGTLWPGGGLVLGLERDGVDVQVWDLWRRPFGDRYVERVEEAGYVATLAWSDGTSPPREPWQRLLGVEGDFEVYGGVPPAG